MKQIKIASPGRINLIGEHIDYNDGFVLPAAIDKFILLTLMLNGSDSRCTIKSKGFDSVLVVDLNNIGQGTEGWHNYVLGVLNEIQKLNSGLRGFDCSMESNVPVGSGVSYQFNINEPDNNNALHGMVYNKRFVFIDEKITGSGASVKLAYHETQSSTGFPFTYSIYLEYVFTQSTLDLNVEIRNTDFKIFPFTLGWHPYFISDDLYNSSFLFDSNLKLKLDNRNITEGIINNENHNNFKMKDQFLDDCFILKTQNVSFLTPSYSLELRTSEKNSFLQLYTPPHKNAIAIEPTTGVSDSFNNEIGLKILKPNEGYKISWTLELK